MARAAVGASLAVFVALVAHVTAGGAMPHLLGVVGPLVLALPAATLLVGRRPSLVGTSAVVAVSQVLFHALFSLGAVGATSTAHHHGAPVSLEDAPTLAVAGMPLAHLAAAALTTLLLHRAERAVLAARAAAGVVAAWLDRLRLPLTPRLDLPAPVRLVVAPVADVEPRIAVLAAVVSRRGPPTSRAA